VRTKFRFSALLAAMIALVVLVSGSTAAYADGGGKGTKVLRLTAEEIQSEFIDLGTPGPSLGDELVFSETLFKNGREVGESGGVCTVVQAVPPYDVLSLHCVATLSLRKGQITLQGLIEVQGMDDPGPFTVAITGGTGKFRCACGEATVRQVTDTTAVYRLKIKDCCKDKKHNHKKHKRHH
jgi:hypothetical protein